jgi:hypothetical protein
MKHKDQKPKEYGDEWQERTYPVSAVIEIAEKYAEAKVKEISTNVPVSGQLPPMFIRWCISKKIEVYSGDAIGITGMSENGAFPVVSAERLFEIFMEETGGNFR